MKTARSANRLRAVLDTNVIVSSLQFPKGTLGGIWQPFHEGRYGIILSKFIVAETARKLRDKFRWEEAELQRSLRAIVRKAEIVEPKTIPRVVPNDSDDDHIVACAVEGLADLIVSGDRDLQALGSYAGIPIVRPADFLRTVTAKF
jgi:uncharacterized protein